MDLKDYKIKNSTTCECGHEFVITEMKQLQRVVGSFYGGIIKHVDEIKCPNCGKDTLLLIKQQGQTYVVKDIAQKDNVVNSQIENDNNVVLEAKQIGTDGLNSASTEIVCSICKRAFKNKSGLSLHMKSHANN